jgi:outer membrane receptor protein involved in Fe transport
LPDYQTTDIKITMPFFGLPNWSAYVQINNLFDIKNVDSYYYSNDFTQQYALYQLPRMIIGGIRWIF